MYNKDLGNVITMTAQGAGTLTAQCQNLRQTGVKVFINVASKTGTLALTVSIYGKDSSGNRKLLLASASITAAGQTVLAVYPGLPATANASANDILPYNFDIEAVVGGTTPSVTGTIHADLIV